MISEPVRIAETQIRQATPEDAAEIANVHLNSWREVYHDLLPQDFLNQLPLTFKRRMSMWKKAATDSNKFLFVAEAECGIVGFSIFGPSRDPELAKHGEIAAIYLLEKFKGKGIGAVLLKMGMKQLFDMKYNSVYCWVLQNNPTIKFYECSGAIFNGMEKEAEIGGQKVKELCYEWKDLRAFRF